MKGQNLKRRNFQNIAMKPVSNEWVPNFPNHAKTTANPWSNNMATYNYTVHYFHKMFGGFYVLPLRNSVSGPVRTFRESPSGDWSRAKLWRMFVDSGCRR